MDNEKKKRPNVVEKDIIWCEVTCSHCGGMLASSGFYSPTLIKRLKAESKEWIEDPEYGILCPECQKSLIKEKGMDMKINNKELKTCPVCGGEIVLYSCMNPEIPYFAFARCKNCKKEFPLPKVKLKVWKSRPTRISQTMINQATREWNKMAEEFNTENKERQYV